MKNVKIYCKNGFFFGGIFVNEDETCITFIDRKTKNHKTLEKKDILTYDVMRRQE